MVWIRLARPNHIKSDPEEIYDATSAELHKRRTVALQGVVPWHHASGSAWCHLPVPPDRKGSQGVSSRADGGDMRRPGPTQDAVVQGGPLLASSGGRRVPATVSKANFWERRASTKWDDRPEILTETAGEANPLLSVLQLAWSEGILQQRRLRNASTRAQTQLSSKALKQQPKHSTARLMFAAGLEMVSVPWGRDAIVQETACGRLVGLTPWQTTEKDHQSFARTVQVGHSLHASMQRH